MNKKRILVVDDEADLCEILKFNLEQNGYEAETALSAEEVLAMDVTSFDLILLDVMMEEISGFQLANILQKNKNTANIPIIFCTARDAEDDVLSGFSVGADDYISKPFSIKEVLARVQAVLKRSKHSDGEQNKSMFSYNDLILDFEHKTVRISGVIKELTKTEFEILALLVKVPGKIYSREALLNLVWHDDIVVGDRTVDVHITRLRKKIEPYGANIKTRMGYGYYFNI